MGETRAEKIEWMSAWCKRNGARLELSGSIGFSRECVGIVAGQVYPDYEWYDSDYERVDSNGEVWTPVDAYHKHTCVAVLGHGEGAEGQLFEWLVWFEQNGFAVQVRAKIYRSFSDQVLGQTKTCRIVRGISHQG